MEEVFNIQPHGLLFDVAGLHDSVVSKVQKKHNGCELLRALVQLTDVEVAIDHSLARGLAK